MNLKYFILLIILLILLIFLILINTNFKETFICIEPTKINTDKVCDSSFQMINNKNFFNNDKTNGYIKVDFKSKSSFGNNGEVYFKCRDNWDGNLKDFDKAHPENLNKNQFYDKLKKDYDGYNFSNVELYKCNKTCPQGKGIIDNSNTCLDCPDKQYNTGDSYECKDISECPSKYNLIKYDYKTGNISCKINSRPGYYYDVNSYSEKPCEKGTYTDSYGNSKCIDVSEGHYVDKIEQTTQKPYKTKCDYGKKLLNNGTTISDKTCEDCPPGHYSDGVSCSQVKAGYKLKEDRSGQIECPAGTYSNAGSESCINCPIGTYTDSSGNSECIDVSEGHYVDEIGQSTQKSYRSSCSIGQKLIGGTATEDKTCEDCPPGHYSDGVSCSQVKAGYKLKEDRSGQVKCPAGTYSNVGSESCITCPENQYQNELGKSNCKNYSIQSCPGGKKLVYGDGKGDNSRCENCPAGEFKAENNALTNCSPCPTNTYSSSPGSNKCQSKKNTCPPGQGLRGGNGQYAGTSISYNTCTDCINGYYSTGGTDARCRVCRSCGSNQYETQPCSSTQNRSCAPYKRNCSSGQKIVDGTPTSDRTCVDCPDGYYSNGWLSECKKVDRGYMRSDNKGGQIPCPGGKYSYGGVNECSPCPSAGDIIAECGPDMWSTGCNSREKGMCYDGNKPLWQYINNTYISSGEFTTDKNEYVTVNSSKLQEELIDSYRAGYYTFNWQNSDWGAGWKNFRYVGSGKEDIITKVYERQGTISENRGVYINIEKAKEAGVFKKPANAKYYNARGMIINFAPWDLEALEAI